MIMETNQDSIEEWMKDMTADTEDHEKDVVDQLPVLEDLQEGLVERAHQSVANHVHCLLSGAGLDLKFWPYAFHHHLAQRHCRPP